MLKTRVSIVGILMKLVDVVVCDVMLLMKIIWCFGKKNTTTIEDETVMKFLSIAVVTCSGLSR